MTALALAPLQWSELSDIDDVEPIGDGDADCLVEIRDVLSKHGKLNRFGVALIHSHFEMAGDEILLETTDEETRTLVTRPVKRSEAGTNNVATVLVLREGDLPVEMASWCRAYCSRWMFGHDRRHNEVPGK